MEVSDSIAKVNILWEIIFKKIVPIYMFEVVWTITVITLTWPHILNQCLENKRLKWMILFFSSKIKLFFFFFNKLEFSCFTMFCFCACMLSHFSCVWRSVTLWTVAFQAPLVHGILQARILEWVALPSSRGTSWPRDWTRVSCIAGSFFTAELPGKPLY